MEKRKSDDLFERRKAVVSQGVGTFVNTTAKRAKGAIIIDADDNQGNRIK